MILPAKIRFSNLSLAQLLSPPKIKDLAFGRMQAGPKSVLSSWSCRSRLGPEARKPHFYESLRFRLSTAQTLLRPHQSEKILVSENVSITYSIIGIPNYGVYRNTFCGQASWSSSSPKRTRRALLKMTINRACKMQKSRISRRQPFGSGSTHTENYKQHAKTEVLIDNVPCLSR